MPQPALHLLLADDVLRHWRARAEVAPFAAAEDAVANAFRHGCLGPDYGLFPGGDARLAAISHRGRTGDLLRAVLDLARTPPQRAFAWGWLTHALADVAIHPLINRAAAAHAGGAYRLADHVRVEVGVDVHFSWQHATLRALRLRPAFDRSGIAFIADAVRRTHGYEVTTSQLMRMQRGMIMFTHAELHFATSLARDLCWDRTKTAVREYPATAALWHVLTALSTRTSHMNAYLNPLAPTAELIEATAAALRALPRSIEHHVTTRLRELPDYNLETGATAPSDPALLLPDDPVPLQRFHLVLSAVHAPHPIASQAADPE